MDSEVKGEERYSIIKHVHTDGLFFLAATFHPGMGFAFRSLRADKLRQTAQKRTLIWFYLRPEMFPAPQDGAIAVLPFFVMLNLFQYILASWRFAKGDPETSSG